MPVQDLTKHGINQVRAQQLCFYMYAVTSDDGRSVH